MAANKSRIPNFKAPSTSRAIISGAVATAVGVVVVVPVYNMVLAPAAKSLIGKVRAAGFLPSA